MGSRYKSQFNIIVLTLVALLLGIMIMVSVYTHSAGQRLEEKNNDNLVSYVETLQDEILALEGKIKSTREKIDSIQSDQAENELLTSSLTTNYNRLAQATGMTEMVGPGILITLDDNTVGAELAQKNNPSVYNPSSYIVHDKDLLYLVRAIAGTADAISINDIRLNDNATIRCVGTMILVNGTRLAPPYEIRAIGDSAQLAALIEKSRRYKLLQHEGKPIKISIMDNLHMPASGSLPVTTYSTPETEAGE